MLAGAQTSVAAYLLSGLDLYVYSRDLRLIERRATIAMSRASYAKVGNDVWEPGDEGIERGSGIKIDVMFREVW